MTDRRPVRRYLTDENVTRSATLVLREMGREALESRDVVGPQAADRVLEFVAADSDLILITRDRDFRTIITGITRRQLRRAARMIWLRIPEYQEAQRLEQCMPMIEEILWHADLNQFDIEYVQVLENELNVKYRLPRLPRE